MARRHLRFALLAATLAAAPTTLSAQNPQPGPPPQGQGQGQAQAPRPMGIDLATARRLAAATEAAAAAANTRVAIAIVDANGDLVHFQRMDGAAARAVTASQAKARAAIMFGMPTKTLQDAVSAGRPISTTITNPGAVVTEVMMVQGALPIMRDGKVVAAVGVGGASAAQDEQFAQAGLNAIGANR